MKSKLSFAKNLWDKFDFLQKDSSDKRKILDEFGKILEERADLEENFAKNLEKISNNMGKLIDKEEFSLLFSSFQTDLKLRINQSLHYCTSIKQEVIKDLKSLMKDQNLKSKVLITEGKKIEKDLKNNTEALEKMKGKFINSTKTSEESSLALLCLKLTCDNAEKIDKQFQRVETHMKEKTEMEKNYKESIDKYNNFLDFYFMQLTEINEAFEVHEIERLTALKITISNAFIYEISTLNEFLYDIDLASKKIITDLTSPHEQVQKFIEKNLTEKKNIEKIKYQVIDNFLSSIISNEELDATNLITEEDVLLEKILFEIFQKAFEKKLVVNEPIKSSDFPTDLKKENIEKAVLISDVMYESWNGDVIKSEMIDRFITIINEERGRKLFTLAFQQYRIVGKFQLTAQGFNNISRLVYEVLNLCLIKKDIMTTLKLMILTFTFYKIGDKISANNYQDFENSESFEKDFLQNVTKEHPIWNITEFWEAAIFCSIREEFKNQKKYLLGLEESREDASFRERNIVFGQLASYCNNMLMFHIDKTTVKDIIGNFCKIFSLLDTQIKDLNNTLDVLEKGLHSSETIKQSIINHKRK